MYKSTTIRLYLALALMLALVAGCSNAEASESIYLPLHEPCPFGSDSEAQLAPDERTELEGNQPSLDPGEWHFSDDFETDLWRSYDGEPISQAAPYMGPTPQATPASTGSQPTTAPSGSTTININEASADKLTDLPGIGPALAERIVDYRRQRYFESASQLQRVDGIGPATLDNIRPLVRVE